MEIVSSSIITFASTNIDDLFVLMLFFGYKNYKTRQIIFGQFLGIIGLISVSVGGSLAGLFIDKAYIGFLGVFPIILGIRALFRLNRNAGATDSPKQNNSTTTNQSKIISVAAITFANGGDNIGIYIPLFATLTMQGKITMIIVFLAMTALWCWIGKYLSHHQVVSKVINRYGHWVTPIVLIILGIYILYESGSLRLIFG